MQMIAGYPVLELIWHAQEKMMGQRPEGAKAHAQTLQEYG